MMRLLIPLVLALLGTGAGMGAALMLAPPPTPDGPDMANPCGDPAQVVPAAAPAPAEPEADSSMEYVKLSNQFVVPVVADDRVAALVVLSLSVEVPSGQRDTVFSREPKLRDIFLQVLFDHANTGGFTGAFTDSSKLDVLRQSLLEAVQKAIPGYVTDVLITDIARQDT